MNEKIRLGVSACLLGERVRYDGGHKRDPYIVETLGTWCDFVPVCPEVEMGLPTPREALRLVGDAENPRLVFARSGEDVTAAMTQWARQRVENLAGEGLCGFIFKGRSPSSGMERVKLYDRNGVPRMVAIGLFAKVFMDRFPLLPVEEDGRLHDPLLRENFIEAIFALKRWRSLPARTPAALIDFHSRHKLQLLAHGTEVYREMGRVVARAGTTERDELFGSYEALFLKGLRSRPTIPRHVNVLQHIQGYFRKELTPDEKAELGEVIADYRRGLVPLIVPVTLLRHYVRKYDKDYLLDQTYLSPHPIELKLRNHA